MIYQRKHVLSYILHHGPAYVMCSSSLLLDRVRNRGEQSRVRLIPHRIAQRHDDGQETLVRYRGRDVRAVMAQCREQRLALPRQFLDGRVRIGHVAADRTALLPRSELPRGRIRS